MLHCSIGLGGLPDWELRHIVIAKDFVDRRTPAGKNSVQLGLQRFLIAFDRNANLEAHW
jgi:hypothetical protein